ncbi:MAG: bifunctional pyr operon transcriptional regulator/uracil phosphoribosyltransferase PyrR [Magnetococcales bacterium]|nr:bifunctional pyr operon transcriptional regulator/uracil phosphoribosyltransferase PyrR [Magnetococcales bacterium]
MSPNPTSETLLHAQEIEARLDAMAEAAAQRMSQSDPREWAIVGVRRGGAVVAQRLAERLKSRFGLTPVMGYLDITFYRDDLDSAGPNPVLEGTELDFDLDVRRILLVDDVLYTGRTIRAGLNALFDYGRPLEVALAVLVDRGQRQLPIQADICGVKLETAANERIKLIGDPGGGLRVVRK